MPQFLGWNILNLGMHISTLNYVISCPTHNVFRVNLPNPSCFISSSSQPCWVHTLRESNSLLLKLPIDTWFTYYLTWLLAKIPFILDLAVIYLLKVVIFHRKLFIYQKVTLWKRSPSPDPRMDAAKICTASCKNPAELWDWAWNVCKNRW